MNLGEEILYFFSTISGGALDSRGGALGFEKNRVFVWIEISNLALLCAYKANVFIEEEMQREWIRF